MAKRMPNRWQQAALSLVLISTPALGQTTSNDQAFPIDPYASQNQASSSDLNRSTTDTGFAFHPFAGPSNQNSSQGGTQNQNQGLRESGTTASTGVGEVGQRQNAADISPGRSPLDRIDNRIQNRVENRLRNRIDRNYDPTANAVSPFADAQRRNQDNNQPR